MLRSKLVTHATDLVPPGISHGPFVGPLGRVLGILPHPLALGLVVLVGLVLHKGRIMVRVESRSEYHRRTT